MSDPEGAAPESMQSQLNRSMGTIWESHTGARPAAVTSEIDGNRVTCAIERADGDTCDASVYRGDAIAAVARVTGRKVNAFIPRHDTKTDVNTDTFLLEPPRVKR